MQIYLFLLGIILPSCINSQNIFKDTFLEVSTIISTQSYITTTETITDEEIKSKSNVYPIVLLHGITSDKSELSSVVVWLEENLPNSVINIEIGNGKQDSIFKTMDWQLNELCATIYNIPILKDGFHFIGMSQGGLLARGYVEKCNKYPVKNLITWVSPHAGVFGIKSLDISFTNIYSPLYQNIYSFSGYWKNPYKYNEYLEYASYLPYLNNEYQDILTYFSDDYNMYQRIDWNFTNNRANLLSLDNFVMIWSPLDDVLNPPESGKFEFFKIKNPSVINTDINIVLPPIVPLYDTLDYINDVLGLRSLSETGRLHILETNCTHKGHKTKECFPQLEELTFKFLI